MMKRKKQPAAPRPTQVIYDTAETMAVDTLTDPFIVSLSNSLSVRQIINKHSNAGHYGAGVRVKVTSHNLANGMVSVRLFKSEVKAS